MASEVLTELTGDTLLRLRQIRRRIVDTNPSNFEGQSRLDAERLIDGFAALIIANEDESMNAVQKQRDLLEETDQHWGDNRPYSSSGKFKPDFVLLLASEVARRARKGNPWDAILESGWADCISSPKSSDLVIAPLSTGAMVARVAQKLDTNSPRLALAVTRFDRPGWMGEQRKTGEAYLPEESSWPNTELKPGRGGVYRLIDDNVITATTLKEIERKLIEDGVDPKLIVR